jgi:MYXO-CTERM domain-containing protein
MKRSLQALRVGLIAGTLMLPAFAQSSGANPNGSASPTATASTPAGGGQTVPGTDMNSPSRTDRGDHDFNFGWLGLVGLAGLLGLRGHHANLYDNEPRGIDNTGPSAVR